MKKNRGRKSRDTLPLIVSPEVDRCRGTFIACLAVDRCKMDIHRVSVCLHCPKRIQIFWASLNLDYKRWCNGALKIFKLYSFYCLASSLLKSKISFTNCFPSCSALYQQGKRCCIQKFWLTELYSRMVLQSIYRYWTLWGGNSSKYSLSGQASQSCTAAFTEMAITKAVYIWKMTEQKLYIWELSLKINHLLHGAIWAKLYFWNLSVPKLYLGKLSKKMSIWEFFKKKAVYQENNAQKLCIMKMN